MQSIYVTNKNITNKNVANRNYNKYICNKYKIITNTNVFYKQKNVTNTNEFNNHEYIYDYLGKSVFLFINLFMFLKFICVCSSHLCL